MRTTIFIVLMTIVTAGTSAAFDRGDFCLDRNKKLYKIVSIVSQSIEHANSGPIKFTKKGLIEAGVDAMGKMTAADNFHIPTCPTELKRLPNGGLGALDAESSEK
jgi:hypothetical protein